MSTKFGIPQRKIDSKLITDEDGELLDYIDTSFFGEVFFRANTNGYDTKRKSIKFVVGVLP